MIENPEATGRPAGEEEPRRQGDAQPPQPPGPAGEDRRPPPPAEGGGAPRHPVEEAAAPEGESHGGDEAPSRLSWYAIRVQSNKEDSVKRSLEGKIKLRGLGRKIQQVVVPTEKIAEIKNGRKRTRQVKTYPGYVLLEMVMDDETWAFVRETPGVGDFVGGGGSADSKPFPLLPEEVSKIFGRDVPGEAAPKIKIDFSVGDKVKIREGPFENFEGVVEEINEQKGLVRVVVTIFGRSTPVELQYWQVENI